MEQKISVKRILFDLISIQPHLIKYYENNDKHKLLLEFLTRKDYYNNDIPYPTLKDIALEIKLSTHQLRKQLKEIYENIFDLETGHTFDFSTSEIFFNIEYNKRYAVFKCHNLKYLPRVGESVHIHFLKAKTGIHFFYVKEIRHSFERCTHFIDIDLKGGIYNSYWNYRLDKAIELGEISLNEQFDLSEYQIKKKLRLRR